MSYFGAKNFNLEIARGNVPGMSHVNKFGHNDAVGNTFETVWTQGTLYTWQSAASTLTVSSDSTNDDGAPAGSGARTVQIYGLDSSGNEQNETITLDGQTAVTTSGTYLRINRMIVRSAGATGSNEGIIYAGTGVVTAGVPANIYSAIAIGDNQTLQAFYTIPTAKTGYMTCAYGYVEDNTKIEIDLFIRPNGEVFQKKMEMHTVLEPVFRCYDPPLIIAALSDIEFRAKGASGATNAVSVEFDIILIDN